MTPPSAGGQMAGGGVVVRAGRRDPGLRVTRASADGGERLLLFRCALSGVRRKLAPRSIDELAALSRTRLKRTHYEPGLLNGLIAGTELCRSRHDVTPKRQPQ